MPIRYSVIEIFTSEEARWNGAPVSKAIVDWVSHLGIAARCMVTRGIGGCYENGEIASSTIEVLSFTMPIKIEIVLPSAELDTLLPRIEDMVEEGLLLVKEQDAWIHKTHSRLIPRHLKVKDVMTPNPQCVHENDPFRTVVDRMIHGGFNGIPVVDKDNHPVGIITQGDLIHRGGLPIRLGLLSEFSETHREELFNQLIHQTAAGIMTTPVVTVPEEIDLTQAVDRMLQSHLKRLPVIHSDGALTGILARVDVFRTVMSQTPDPQWLTKHHITVTNIRLVREIMERDLHTVQPDTPVEQIMKSVDWHVLHRVAVVDPRGVLVGVISDRDLLAKFSTQRAGLWPLILSKVPLLRSAAFYEEIVHVSRARTASDIMKTELISVTEETTLQEAIKQMTQFRLKRLPVVDAQGLFKGMISRDAILRLGCRGENELDRLSR